MNKEEMILQVDIDLIEPNKNQPRKIFNEESLKELSSSIQKYGILNPILVRKKNDKYEIIAGERRIRAAKMVGLKEVPVIIKTVEDNKATEIAIIENLQRENITPIEEAQSYKELLEKEDITQLQLSEMIGKSQSFISNKLRLLNLPKNIQDALANRKISERHARSLLTVDTEEKQTELLNRIINEKLTVKEIDNIINEKNITEEDIKNSVNDIFEMLNMNKEEEKESDNMNNGNFFPNYNTNPSQGNEMSLNSINMQSMNDQNSLTFKPINNLNSMEAQQPEQQIQPMPNFPTPDLNQTNQMPTFSPIENNSMQYSQPMEIPSINPMEYNQPEPMPAITPMQNQYVAQPEQPNQNISMAPLPEIQQPILEVPQMQEQPLFNPEVSMHSQSPEIPTIQPSVNYEIPVSGPQINETPTQELDKLSQTEKLLSENGIEYKLYSNEQGHCIIIEL